jgi:hypothetical protein
MLIQHLDELEQEAEREGGVLQTLSGPFAKEFRAPTTTVLAAQTGAVR